MLWAIPAVASVVGVVLVIVGLRAVGDATTELRRSLARLDEVRAAVNQLRAEASPVVRGIHHPRRAPRTHR